MAGNTGTEQLSFSSGTTVSAIAAGINSVTTATGVSATVSGTDLVIDSTEFGSEQFVSVKAVAGAFTVTGGASGKDYGRHADVKINGAAAQTNGKSVSYRSSNLDIEFDLDDTFNLAGSDSFSITFGRTELAKGNELHLGDLDFYAGIAHDGVIANWDFKKIDITGWYTRPVEGSVFPRSVGGRLSATTPKRSWHVISAWWSQARFVCSTCLW